MKRVAVIHQLPLEYYPPATNLLDYLSRNEDLVIDAYSTVNPKERPNWTNSRIRITRFPFPRAKQPALFRLADYVRFILGTAWRLAVSRPQAVLYIEPHSALPAYLYKRILNTKAAIFHHCHEYYAPADFERTGMRLVKVAHRFESGFLYGVSTWISQTNADRVRLMSEDHPDLEASRFHILPNYPPASWGGTANTAWLQPPLPLRCVYVGSVSLEDTYIREVCAWVKRQNGDMTLDLYAYNVTAKTDAWLRDQSESGNSIRYFRDGLAYEDLPRVLPGYHVGLILYRGNTENFIWNAPNKLFEYLACGLDVWYPPVMRGMHLHLAEDVIPKVLSVDFEDLDSIDLAAMTDREGLNQRDGSSSCDSVLRELESSLLEV